jgi:2-methylisocitrate lyase-like PEP mutase family enzyme
MSASTERLRHLLQGPDLLLMPCCFDALSARLIEQAGFPLTFMSGFAVSATRLALPDTGLISYAEMLDQGRSILDAVSFPVIGDGDTGYGNPANVRRTVRGYARAGFAGVMIEDQLAPKRCGHTRGKEIVDRAEALARIRAAVDARDEGADILIMARTDARAAAGIDEALWRMQAFADLGADILFLEAPENEAEMIRFCAQVPGPKMANLLEGGVTPVVPPRRLQEIGYRIAAYPLALLNSVVHAMREALGELAAGHMPTRCVDFATIRGIVGFDEYDRALQKYLDPDRVSQHSSASDR